MTDRRIEEIRERFAKRETCSPKKYPECDFDDHYRCTIHGVEDADIEYLLVVVEKMETRVAGAKKLADDNYAAACAAHIAWDDAERRCCLDNTHTTQWSDGYTQECKTHRKKHTTDTGWNR